MAKAEDIANHWANQSEKGPKKAGTFWRDGAKAGHYGSCVARLIEGSSGDKVALIWDDYPGLNTKIFLNLCTAAAKKAGIETFRVPEITEEGHTENLLFFESKAAECEAKIARARTVDWQKAADEFRAKAAEYRKAFNL